jgi:hypothetical protein
MLLGHELWGFKIASWPTPVQKNVLELLIMNKNSHAPNSIQRDFSYLKSLLWNFDSSLLPRLQE